MHGGTKIWIDDNHNINDFSPDNTLCNTCIYRTVLFGKWGCGYLLYTNNKRNCSPINCNKYTKGKRKQVSNMENFTYDFLFD